MITITLQRFLYTYIVLQFFFPNDRTCNNKIIIIQM